MANFDPNKWHQLYTNEDQNMTLFGSELTSPDDAGAVFMRTAQIENPNFRWQLFAINETTYIIRNQKAGGFALMGTKYDPNATYNGRTYGQMVRNNKSDDSVFWTISPWTDGTSYLTNQANGTDWRLANFAGRIYIDSAFSVDPNSNKKAPDGFRWSLTPIDNATIDDENFSSVDLPTQTVTSAASGSPTPSGSATTSTAPPTSGGLSTAAKAGIGAGVGGAALIALVLLALFFWRRRKQKMAPSPPYEYKDWTPAHEGLTPYEESGNGTEGPVKYEMYHDNNVKHEMPEVQDAPVELPSSAVECEAR